MVKKTIIFTHSGGRLGNQLISYIHLLSFWQEHKDQFNIINISFWPFSHLLHLKKAQRYCFHSTSNSGHVLFWILYKIYLLIPRFLKHKYVSFLTIFLHGFGSFFPGFQSIFARKSSIQTHLQPFCFGKKYDFFDLNLEENKKMLLAKHSVITGFQVKSWELVLKHKKETLPLLAFNPLFQNTASQFMKSVRSNHKIVVGVHIRQGDWRNHPKSITDTGRIAFDAKTYATYMQQLVTLLGPDVGFILTSDEVQDMTLFKEFNVYLCTGSMGQSGHFVESILELSQCDYLLMPDTTFAGWASFMNDVEMFVFRSDNAILSLDNLSKIKQITGFVS